MKKIAVFLITVSLLLSAALPVSAAQEIAITIDKEAQSESLSPLFWGVALDDGWQVLDGGLNVEMVQNGSFESRKQPENAWGFNNVGTVLSTEAPLHARNVHYEVLTLNGKGALINHGFRGENGMSFEKDEVYRFVCYIKNINFEGTLRVYLDSKGNRQNSLSQLPLEEAQEGEWKRFSANLQADKTENGVLTLAFDGKGSLALDAVSLVPKSSYGFGNDRWQHTALRTDAVEALRDLQPAFIRFPGSSFSVAADEGYTSWKDTVGALITRRNSGKVMQNPEEETVYNDENGVGYHEFFQLCEDLNALPVPTVGAAESLDGDDFVNYVNDVADLAEYANGDEALSLWGAARAQNGHPEPFNMQYLCVAGDSADEAFDAHVAAIQKAIARKDKSITVLPLTEDASALSQAFAWEQLALTEEQAFAEGNRFDGYDREGAAVMAGLYALSEKTHQTQEQALAAAAFLCGAERNGDKVKMAYALPALTNKAGNPAPSLVMLDQSAAVKTPAYYSQLILANNRGDTCLETDFVFDEEQGVYQSTTLDKGKQAVYVKLVNTGSKKNVTLRFQHFDSLNAASLQSVAAGKAAHNTAQHEGVQPREQALSVKGDAVSLTLDANSVNVVRVAYGNNAGDFFYALPETVNTRRTAPSAKTGIAVMLAALGVGFGIGYVVYFKYLRKKKPKSKK